MCCKKQKKVNCKEGVNHAANRSMETELVPGCVGFERPSRKCCFNCQIGGIELNITAKMGGCR